MRNFHTSIVSLLLVFLAGLALTATATLAQSGVSISAKTTMHWAHSDGHKGFEVNAFGEVIFLADDSGVARISEGGFLTIRVRKNGGTVYLDIRPGHDGSLTYDYRVDGRRVDYADADQRELADLFLMIIRETGMGASERVGRILRNDGVASVFTEIGQIESGSSVRRYLSALVEQGSLNGRELQRAARVAQNEIDSGGDRARFLRQTAASFMAEDDAVDAFFDAVSSVPSPGDKARTLRAALEAKPGRGAMLRLITEARAMKSSGDKTQVLMATIGYFSDDSAIRDAYFDAVETIDSPGNRSRLLISLLSEYEIDSETAELAFRNAAGIKSSGDKARVLIQAAPHYANTEAQRGYFFDAVGSISSSGDHARVLLALLGSENLGKATLMSLLKSVRDISASGDAARVLRGAAPYMSDDELVDAYLKAAETISAPRDRSRALTALMSE